MKIAARISAGFIFLIALIVGVLAYQISLFSQMEFINREMTQVDFRSSIVALQLLRDLDPVEEFTRKLYATRGDPDYGARLDDLRSGYGERMKTLDSFHPSGQEKLEADKLTQIWSEFLKSSAIQDEKYHGEKQSPASYSRETEEGFLRQIDSIEKLRDQAQSLIGAQQRTVEARVRESSAAALHAQKVSWTAAAGAFVLSLIVSFWIFRSISGPLRQLTEGTRAVAEGNYSYQIDASGNDEMAHLASDFNVMTRRLGELDSLKKDFVSHVSHELKTPLASIEETIRLLLEEIPGTLNPQQKRFLELSLQSSKRLSAMIRNLLDLSRIDAGVMQYEMKPNDLREIANVVVNEFEAPLHEKNLKLKTDFEEGRVPVQCDRERIVQVFVNILGNALKFVPRDTEIRVSLRRLPEVPASAPESVQERMQAGKRANGFAIFSIADRGPGVPDSEKARIFDKFHRIPQANRAPSQDTGLGLAISRTIVEAHRGAIWVEDREGGGSVFSVLLETGGEGTQAARQSSTPI